MPEALEVVLMSNELTHEGDSQLIPQPTSLTGRFIMYGVPYLVLYAIAVTLVAMTDHDPATAQGAWDYFVPLVGLVSTISGWSRHAGYNWQMRLRYVLRQIIHWGALLVVIHLLFQADVQHFLRAETDGFVIVYLLGLAGLLSGLYLDWKMALFGLFLLLSGVLMAQLEDNAMLLTVLALVGLAGVAVSLLVRSRVKHHGAEPASAS